MKRIKDKVRIKEQIHKGQRPYQIILDLLKNGKRGHNRGFISFGVVL